MFPTRAMAKLSHSIQQSLKLCPEDARGVSQSFSHRRERNVTASFDSTGVETVRYLPMTKSDDSFWLARNSTAATATVKYIAVYYTRRFPSYRSQTTNLIQRSSGLCLINRRQDSRRWHIRDLKQNDKSLTETLQIENSTAIIFYSEPSLLFSPHR